MKRVFIILLLTLCLSVPAFSGHTQTGNRRVCGCNVQQGICPCCGSFLGAAISHENDYFDQNASGEAQPAVELGIIRLAFLMWLKIKA